VGPGDLRSGRLPVVADKASNSLMEGNSFDDRYGDDRGSDEVDGHTERGATTAYRASTVLFATACPGERTPPARAHRCKEPAILGTDDHPSS